MGAAPANAQRGVIVIEGEITAPTCVLNNMRIASVGISQSVLRKDCDDNKMNISPNALSEIAQIREDAVADNSKKRISFATSTSLCQAVLVPTSNVRHVNEIQPGSFKSRATLTFQFN